MQHISCKIWHDYHSVIHTIQNITILSEYHKLRHLVMNTINMEMQVEVAAFVLEEKQIETAVAVQSNNM